MGCNGEIGTANGAAETRDRGAAVEQHIAAIASLSESLLRGVDTALDEVSNVNLSTQLLSVNARIEAARAGAAGGSFAVVATEMNRLSSEVKSLTARLRGDAHETGRQMRHAVEGYVTQVRDARLCELALTNIDLIDRNLYERSCDVRWWATDAAAVDCVRDPSAPHRQHAQRRLGQILDSYTVYSDLVLVDVHGHLLGVLGILFDWDALAGTIVRRTPLTADEWARTRVCIIDNTGRVLADSMQDGTSQLDISVWKALLKQPRSSAVLRIEGRETCVAHAASPGYETYRSGWHGANSARTH